MAYNNYFPATYQPFQYQQYQQYPQYQNFQQMPQQLPQMNNFQNGNSSQMQIQNGGFISVHNIQEAFNYPVAPGNSVTFKDENSPYIYVKTKGFSQLEEPIFKKFRLIEESDTQTQESVTGTSNEQTLNYMEFAKTSDITALWGEIDALKKQIAELTAKPEKVTKRKEVDSNV